MKVSPYVQNVGRKGISEQYFLEAKASHELTVSVSLLVGQSVHQRFLAMKVLYGPIWSPTVPYCSLWSCMVIDV